MPCHITDKSRYGCSFYQSVMAMSLIELMIVVVIIGILASLIFPSFRQQILLSRRGDGISQLLQLKIQQESFRVENPQYATTEQLSLPTSEYYTFSVQNQTATTYTLIATAKDSQANDTDCKVLSVDQSMNKSPDSCFY